MLLKIFQYDHPILRVKGSKIEKIDASIREFANSMIETMRYNNACGLAAHHVGRSIQLVVLDILPTVQYYPSTAIINGKKVSLESIMPLILINAQISILGTKFEFLSEGSVSFPGIQATISRVCHINVSYQDINGNVSNLEAKQFLARVIQHEVDHSDAKLIIDYMSQEEYKQQEILINKIKLTSRSNS